MAASPGSSGHDEPTVLGSVDGKGTAQEYVIADISEDGAWLAMDIGDALELDSWR